MVETRGGAAVTDASDNATSTCHTTTNSNKGKRRRKRSKASTRKRKANEIANSSAISTVLQAGFEMKCGKCGLIIDDKKNTGAFSKVELKRGNGIGWCNKCVQSSKRSKVGHGTLEKNETVSSAGSGPGLTTTNNLSINNNAILSSNNQSTQELFHYTPISNISNSSNIAYNVHGQSTQEPETFTNPTNNIQSVATTSRAEIYNNHHTEESSTISHISTFPNNNVSYTNNYKPTTQVLNHQTDTKMTTPVETFNPTNSAYSTAAITQNETYNNHPMKEEAKVNSDTIDTLGNHELPHVALELVEQMKREDYESTMQVNNFLPNPKEVIATKTTTSTTTTASIDTQSDIKCSKCGESKPRHSYRMTEVYKSDDYRTCNSCLITKCGACGLFIQSHYFSKKEYEKGDGVGKCNTCVNTCVKLDGTVGLCSKCNVVRDRCYFSQSQFKRFSECVPNKRPLCVICLDRKMQCSMCKIARTPLEYRKEEWVKSKKRAVCSSCISNPSIMREMITSQQCKKTKNKAEKQTKTKCIVCHQAKDIRQFMNVELEKLDGCRTCTDCLKMSCAGCKKIVKKMGFTKKQWKRGNGVGLCKGCCNGKAKSVDVVKGTCTETFGAKRKLETESTEDTVSEENPIFTAMSSSSNNESSYNKNISQDDLKSLSSPSQVSKRIKTEDNFVESSDIMKGKHEKVKAEENENHGNIESVSQEESGTNSSIKDENDGQSDEDTEAMVHKFMGIVLTYHEEQKKTEQSDSYTRDPNERILVRDDNNNFVWATASTVFPQNQEESTSSDSQVAMAPTKQRTSIWSQNTESIPSTLNDEASIPEENDISTNVAPTSNWPQRSESIESESKNDGSIHDEENDTPTTNLPYVWRRHNTNSFVSRLYEESLTSPSIENDIWFDFTETRRSPENSDHIESASENEESISTEIDISTNMTTTKLPQNAESMTTTPDSETSTPAENDIYTKTTRTKISPQNVDSTASVSYNEESLQIANNALPQNAEPTGSYSKEYIQEENDISTSKSTVKSYSACWEKVAKQFTFSLPSPEMVEAAEWVTPHKAVKDLFKWTSDQDHIDEIVSIFLVERSKL